SADASEAVISAYRWWTHLDLNQGPLACEASALTGLSYASTRRLIIAPACPRRKPSRALAVRAPRARRFHCDDGKARDHGRRKPWSGLESSDGRGYGSHARRNLPGSAKDPESETIEIEINNRNREERQRLAYNEAADDRDSQRTPQFRSHTGTDCEGQAAQQGRQRRHHDRSKAQQTGLENRLFGSLALASFRIERKVDHQDSVLLNDADKQDDSDEGDDIQVDSAKPQREQCPDTGRR